MQQANKIDAPRLRIMLSVGDASADLYASELIKALTERYPNCHIYGMGGAKMQAQHFETIVDATQLSVIGFTEVLGKLRQLKRAMRSMQQAIEQTPPDILILMDYGTFNLKLAKFAASRNIHVTYYICPQIWAHRRYRLRALRRYVDDVAVIFPFEKVFYAEHNIKAYYVGHPLLPKIQAALELPKSPGTYTHPVIGIVPGSRPSEIKRMLPEMIGAAKILKARYPTSTFLLLRAPCIAETVLQTYLDGIDLPMHIQSGDVHTSIQQCDVLMATSGTVTFEIGLLAKPHVIVYKVNRITAAILKYLLHVPFIGICNILAKCKIVPELLQNECHAPAIASALMQLLDDVHMRQQMIDALKALRIEMSNTWQDMPIEDLVAQSLCQAPAVT